ncbi:hypothetical protein [Pedobacter sp. L105]|uniref:hypothetical protein n=1 Tax=Pedobacter sp. L105 TaxID=1641871 RepID=UPI00131BF7CF|nr:hypothetical protein [Pedobacter sp. L105]
MYKIIPLFILFYLMFNYSYAQTNIFPDNGNVGIGTVNPQASLDVNGTENLNGNLTFSTDQRAYFVHALLNGGAIRFRSNALSPTDRNLQFGNMDNNGTFYSYMTVGETGNIGIGTVSPRVPLDVAIDLTNQKLGSVFGRLPEGDNQGEGTFLGVRGYSTNPNSKGFAIEHSFYGIINSSINFFRGGTTDDGCIAFNTYHNTEKMRIDVNGNVGIGTSTPKEKLSVNGKIRAQEVMVETANWPDFVFESSYHQKSVEGLEAFIQKHKHLPDMPSAEEAETSGISLGEMNKKLLKKVEELTLYMIEQHKEIEALKKKVKYSSK